jgi:hypothetical protein
MYYMFDRPFLKLASSTVSMRLSCKQRVLFDLLIVGFRSVTKAGPAAYSVYGP